MYQCPYFNMLRNLMYYNFPIYDDEIIFDIEDAYNNFTRTSRKKSFTKEEALEIGRYLNVKFDKFDVEQFRIGLEVELEHGTINPFTNITNDDAILTGKITLAHLNEFPDYYTRLNKMEKEALEYWGHED